LHAVAIKLFSLDKVVSVISRPKTALGHALSLVSVL